MKNLNKTLSDTNSFITEYNDYLIGMNIIQKDKKHTIKGLKGDNNGLVINTEEGDIYHVSKNDLQHLLDGELLGVSNNGFYLDIDNSFQIGNLNENLLLDCIKVVITN